MVRYKKGEAINGLMIAMKPPLEKVANPDTVGKHAQVLLDGGVTFAPKTGEYVVAAHAIHKLEDLVAEAYAMIISTCENTPFSLNKFFLLHCARTAITKSGFACHSHVVFGRFFHTLLQHVCSLSWASWYERRT